jgi:hypothetical protein
MVAGHVAHVAHVAAFFVAHPARIPVPDRFALPVLVPGAFHLGAVSRHTPEKSVGRPRPESDPGPGSAHQPAKHPGPTLHRPQP